MCHLDIIDEQPPPQGGGFKILCFVPYAVDDLGEALLVVDNGDGVDGVSLFHCPPAHLWISSSFIKSKPEGMFMRLFIARISAMKALAFSSSLPLVLTPVSSARCASFA